MNKLDPTDQMPFERSVRSKCTHGPIRNSHAHWDGPGDANTRMPNVSYARSDYNHTQIVGYDVSM